jgi:protein-S-isoprenylcysteine O-methyltransferase Ste14
MNHETTSAYGLWWLVIVNSALFILFAISFVQPKTKWDWRSLGGFSAFILALFTEMYGFPLTIYLLSGWLTRLNPGVDIYSHDAGHLWQTILGWKGDYHFGWLHILSNILILLGFWLLSSAWRVLHVAQQRGHLAVTGPYARVRHPQYIGFVIIMFGFLVQWPTLPTLVMFPILVWTYVRLAKREEGAALNEFGDLYREYMRRVPAFIPKRHSGIDELQKERKSS